jgi:predicted DNA-binding WGR domain protein
MKIHFVLQNEKSDKFWFIEQNDNKYTVNFGKNQNGRIGGNGKTLEKEFETEELCKKAIEKQINQKIKQGYIEQDELFLEMFAELYHIFDDNPEGKIDDIMVKLENRKEPLKITYGSKTFQTAFANVSAHNYVCVKIATEIIRHLTKMEMDKKVEEYLYSFGLKFAIHTNDKELDQLCRCHLPEEILNKWDAYINNK